MPEGDVLARVADRLGKALGGTELTLAHLRWPSVEPEVLLGKRITETVSYGKHLLQRTTDGFTLHTHLRMDGFWRIAAAGSPDATRLMRNPKARAVLGNDRWTCVGIDLGMLDVIRTRDEQRLLGDLGPDLLAQDFETVGLSRVLATVREHSSLPICEVLLNQRFVAGIGTIYMAESLFAHRIWPWTPVGSIDEPSLAQIYLTARALMLRVVRGGFNARVSHAHGRRGKPCHRCGTPIVRGAAEREPYQRPVFYCPRCQAASDTSH